MDVAHRPGPNTRYNDSLEQPFGYPREPRHSPYPGSGGSSFRNNGAEGTRTPDPNTASVVLSQLSYSPNASSWWRQGDSNPRPLQCDCSALPAELCPQGSSIFSIRQNPKFVKFGAGVFRCTSMWTGLLSGPARSGQPMEYRTIFPASADRAVKRPCGIIEAHPFVLEQPRRPCFRHPIPTAVPLPARCPSSFGRGAFNAQQSDEVRRRRLEKGT